MKIFNSLDDMDSPRSASLALGTFDGLHRGHMAVINAAGENADPALEIGVVTFESSPSGSAAVITAEDKLKLMREVGVSRVYSFRFEDIKSMPAEEFVKTVLFDKCNAKRLCCGEDFRFGSGAVGDVVLLRKMCADAGVLLTVIPPVSDGGEKISSTRIRAAVEAGDIPTANRLLGRPFGFCLEVIHGNHIGTGLGTPTINQALPQGFVMPKFGVYASWAEIEGEFFYGVTNIGVKPTVGSDKVLSETWMPDFSGDIYGKHVRLNLLDFIRAERKFSSLDELKIEIEKNAVQAKNIAENNPIKKINLK